MILAQIFLLACAPALAGSLSPAAQAVWRSGEAELARLDFAEARRVFAAHIEEEPEDPSGYLFDAAALLWSAASEPVDGPWPPEKKEAFENRLEAALKRAKRLQGADGLFAEGAVWGLRAMAASREGSRRKARSLAKKSRKAFEACLKKDPRFHDAYLGIGLAGLEDDREAGIAALRTAFESGRLAPNLAGFFLLRAFVLERRDYASALPVVRTLLSRHPDSALLRVVETAALHRTGEFEASLRSGEKLWLTLQSRPEYLGRLHPRIVCGLYGHRCFERGAVAAWVEWASRAIEQRRLKASQRSLLGVYRVLGYSLLGDGDFARSEFKRIEPGRETAELTSAAEVCGQGRCSRADVVEVLRQLSGLPGR